MNFVFLQEVQEGHLDQTHQEVLVRPENIEFFKNNTEAHWGNSFDIWVHSDAVGTSKDKEYSQQDQVFHAVPQDRSFQEVPEVQQAQFFQQAPLLQLLPVKQPPNHIYCLSQSVIYQQKTKKRSKRKFYSPRMVWHSLDIALHHRHHRQKAETFHYIQSDLRQCLMCRKDFLSQPLKGEGRPKQIKCPQISSVVSDQNQQVSAHWSPADVESTRHTEERDFRFSWQPISPRSDTLASRRRLCLVAVKSQLILQCEQHVDFLWLCVATSRRTRSGASPLCSSLRLEQTSF